MTTPHSKKKCKHNWIIKGTTGGTLANGEYFESTNQCSICKAIKTTTEAIIDEDIAYLEEQLKLIKKEL